SYSISTSAGANNAVLSTTITSTTTTTVPPYYVVQAADTSWANVAQNVYGDSQAGDALKAQFGGAPAPTAGAHLAMQQTLAYTRQVPGSMSTVILDPLLGQTTMLTNAQGQLIQIVSPIGQSTTFGYNANGDVTSVTDAKGQV